MDDLISRQAAIALAYFHGKTATWNNLMLDGIDAGVNAVDVADLEELPAVQIELRHGYWIADNARPKSILYRCSVCREIAHDRPYGSLKREPKKTCKMKYCPHCGAKMESEESK